MYFLSLIRHPRLTGIYIYMHLCVCENLRAYEKHGCDVYPLVNVYIAIENGHRNSEFSHSKWWIFP